MYYVDQSGTYSVLFSWWYHKTIWCFEIHKSWRGLNDYYLYNFLLSRIQLNINIIDIFLYLHCRNLNYVTKVLSNLTKINYSLFFLIRRTNFMIKTIKNEQKYLKIFMQFHKNVSFDIIELNGTCLVLLPYWTRMGLLGG